jgi:hypothetical protein
MSKRRVINLLLTISLIMGIGTSTITPISITVSAAPAIQTSNGPDTPQDAPNHSRVMAMTSVTAGETTVKFDPASRKAKFLVENGWDMDQYLFADSSPLDFYIDLQGYRPDPTKSTTITLRVFDVDQIGAPGFPECRVEVDRVFLNGVYLGNLTGANNQWSIVTFSIPAGVLSSGQNHVRIDIDVLTGWCWAVEVDWAQVEMPFNIAQVEASAFDDVTIKRGTSNDTINDPIWKNSFDSSGNISFSANLNDPIADKIAGGWFNIGAREFKYKYKIDNWPSSARPTWQPKVKYFWEIQGMGIQGNGEQTGWEKDFKVTLPDKIGKYTLKVVLDIYQGNNLLRTENRTHTLYVLLDSPQLRTIVSGWNIIDTSKPKTAWLDIATSWADGKSSTSDILGALNSSEYGNGHNPLGWGYGYPKEDPLTLIENGAGKNGDCFVFRDVWRILAGSLGIGTGSSDYSPGLGFMTSTRPALDNNASANAKNKATGQRDRWFFSNHQFGTYGGNFYDPTYGLTGPNNESGKEGNVFCKVDGSENGAYRCTVLNPPPSKALVVVTSAEINGWTVLSYETINTSTNLQQGMMSNSSAVAGTGSFTGYASDMGYDANSNGLFEHLQVDVEINVTEAGRFGFVSFLTDSTGNLITMGSLDPSLSRDAPLTSVALALGTQNVSLYFNGDAIRASIINGPYNINIGLTDENGVLVASTTHVTKLYNYSAFEGLLFEMSSITDLGVDTDAQPGYNLLRVAIEFNTLAAGNAVVQGQLFAGDTFIADIIQSVPLSPGRQTVNMDFPGEAIAANGLNGPYTAYLTVSDGNYLDSLVYITPAYLSASFQLPIAFFTGDISDTGVDTNGNGLYESLMVSVEAVTLVPGTYTVSSILQDSNGIFIAAGETSIDLSKVPTSVSMSFDGKAIYHSSVDGPYQVLLAISDSEGNDIAGLKSVTSTFTYSSFEHPEAVFTGLFSDNGIDSDGDGFYNWLNINIGTQVVESGLYVFKGSLTDENGNFIAAATVEQFLNAGSNTLDLEFDGRTINLHGVNGSYKLIGLVLSRADGTILDYVLDAYKTNEYEYAQFQPSDLLLTGVFQDYGQDNDGNGLLNELVVNMEVVIAQSDYYYFNARLVDAYGEEIIWASQSQYLTPGKHLISLIFDGRYIYGNQSDGPYEVMDLSIYHGDETVSVIDLHTTRFYSWEDFERAGIVRGAVFVPGQPAPQATIFISGIATDLTDNNGLYRLTVLNNGTYVVNIEADPSLAPWTIWVNGVKTSEGTNASIQVTIGSITEVNFVSTKGLNSPPTLPVLENQNVQYGDLLSFTISAIDLNDPSDSLTFSSTSLPNDLNLTNNGDGTATISGVSNVAPGTYTVEITVTDPDGLSDTKAVDIVVTKEDARTTYTGPLMVSTGCEACSTAVVPLRATIQDITAVMSDPAYDPDAGNITNATVSFVDRNNGDAVLCSSNIVLLDPSDQKVGTAFCDWTADLGNSPGLDYVVGVVVNGYYTRNSSDEDTVVVVSKPTSNFITGGGYFVNQNSGGTYYGDLDLKTNFGLNIKFNKKLTNLQGRVTIIVRQGGRVYQIKSNALNSLVSVPYNPAKPRTGTAEMIGRANITDVTDPLNPIAVIGNATLNIMMKDNGEPGNADLISISLWSRDGELLFSSHWDGVQTLQQLLDGGNLNIK